MSSNRSEKQNADAHGDFKNQLHQPFKVHLTGGTQVTTPTGSSLIRIPDLCSRIVNIVVKYLVFRHSEPNLWPYCDRSSSFITSPTTRDCHLCLAEIGPATHGPLSALVPLIILTLKFGVLSSLPIFTNHPVLDSTVPLDIEHQPDGSIPDRGRNILQVGMDKDIWPSGLRR
ncbi:hypothetical protein PGT21_034173 [Puccinia graminis f. sp. tritici]|uniref:Uncharacterized protein n=1 Tax=Puccinia graminis f. sp. tritici TaxID=56615 RepID=A0A5B0P9V1_PUCGR|nr:hypothetical protein PGT21_034173 [Puccinia graminis f. sp. tritici]KAA1125635.1 hypothetical protein PGTUg99_014833 [Puccinia graminis f. sp. tritici]